MRIKRNWQRIVGWTRGLLVPLHEDSGQALAEYGLILALVFAGSVIVLGVLGLALVGLINLGADSFP